jgi:hypothetical protein
MKLRFTAFALLVCGAFCCNNSYGGDLLGRMMGRGCGADAVPTCCDTPAAACGGRSVSGIFGRGFLSGRCGRGIGCGSYASAGCGTDNVMANTGSCDACGNGIVGGRMRGRLCGMFSRFGGGDACDMGCDNGCGGAPVAAGCGANAAFNNSCSDPCASSGLLGGRGFGRFGNFGGWNNCDMGCAAPMAAPVANGCGVDGGFGSGLKGCGGMNLCGRLGSRFGRGQDFADCGCGDAPVAAGCGCNDGGFVQGCGFGSRRGCLLGRLRGGRGNGIGAGCGTDGGYVVANANCGCNGGQVIDNGGQHMEHRSEGAGDVVTPPGETSQLRSPRIDPNAFIIRNAGFRN